MENPVKIDLNRKYAWTDQVTRADFSIENMSGKDIEIVFIDVSVYSKKDEFLGKSILTTQNIKSGERVVASCDFMNIKPSEIDHCEYLIKSTHYYKGDTPKSDCNLTIQKSNMRQIGEDLVWVNFTVTNNSKYFIHNGSISVSAYSGNGTYLGNASISLDNLRAGDSYSSMQTSFFNISLSDIKTFEYAVKRIDASINNDEEKNMTNSFSITESSSKSNKSNSDEYAGESSNIDTYGGGQHKVTFQIESDGDFAYYYSVAKNNKNLYFDKCPNKKVGSMEIPIHCEAYKWAVSLNVPSGSYLYLQASGSIDYLTTAKIFVDGRLVKSSSTTMFIGEVNCKIESL